MSKPNDCVKRFGKNLIEVMDSLEMSQSKLSELSGLTQAAISQVINGKREPSINTIVRILKVIPVSFERLIR